MGSYTSCLWSLLCLKHIKNSSGVALRIDLQAAQENPSHESKWVLEPLLPRWTTCFTQRINFELFLESKAPNKEKRFDTPEDVERIDLGFWKVSRTFSAMTPLSELWGQLWRQLLWTRCKGFSLASYKIGLLNFIIVKILFWSTISWEPHRLNQWQNDSGICLGADKLWD